MSRTNRYRPGEKSTGVRVGYLSGKPSLIANWGGRMYGVPLSLDGAGNDTRDSNFGNIRVKGDAVIDSGASVLRIRSDGISIKESDSVVASFGATTTIGSFSAASNGNITVTDILLDGRITLKSGENSLGADNIMIGESVLTSPSNGANECYSNIAIGLNSLSGAVNGGEYNVSIGNYTLDALTSGDYNTAIGYNAGTAVSTSGSNVYIGGLAGEDHSGENSVIIGRDAALDSTSSNDSVYIGHQSAGGAITTGDDNVCVGKEAGKELTGGAGNTFVGYKAGDTCTTPGGNICVGYEADVSGADQQNAIIIGYNITGGGNTFNFGKASNIVSNTFTSDANWSQSSDLRKKRNIKDDTLGLDFINDLRTVKFQWKPSNELPKECDDYSEENNMDTDVVMHGFIAQEVKSSLDKVGVDTFSGWSVKEDGMQHVSREMFVVPLIKAVQELSAEVKELKAKLEDK